MYIFSLASSKSGGFNATFNVNRCPSECTGRRACINNVCVCQPGYSGINCEIELCPQNCSSQNGSGHCHKVMLNSHQSLYSL